MESIAALGLASNIIQIVDFSSRLISHGRELYNSADGRTTEHTVLDDAIKALAELHSSLKITSGSRSYGSLTVADRHLIQLKAESERAVDELQQVLEKARLKNPGSNRKWQSIRQALSSVRTDKEISALAARLDKIRGQIDTAVLISIRTSLEKTQTIVDMSSLQAASEEHADIKRAELLNTILSNNWQASSPSNLAAFSAHLDSIASDQMELSFRKSMLAQLYFHVMPDREHRIPNAHSRTFEWLFENEPQNQHRFMKAKFTHWLRADSNEVYWITGKPGSGKSTLMKFLYHHRSLPPLLREWANSNILISAGFYFWNSGSALQMSLVGLLRTLLYQCLSTGMASITRAMPERWEQYRAFGGGQGPFGETELIRIMERMLEDTSRKFFFLIDGLDEFSGDAGQIIDLVSGIAKRNIKICIASRPWLAFEEAFGHQPRLRLQDLTMEDIATYVVSKFENNAHFRHLQSSHPQASAGLLDQIVAKSSGVFLWVYLVVQSLLVALQNSDRLSDVEARLNELPGDLEDLFTNLLGRLGTGYYRQACETFRLLRAFRDFSYENGPTLLALYYTDDQNPKSSLRSQVKHFEESSMIESTMSRRLNARCKGFLETSESADGSIRVEYLHRTARDFVESGSYYRQVMEATDHDAFKPLEHWANALLWVQRSPAQTFLLNDLMEYVRCIHMIQNNTGLVQRSLLDAYCYVQIHRHEHFESPKGVSNTELLNHWGVYDTLHHLDAYMALLLVATKPHPKSAYLTKPFAAKLSARQGLFWRMQSYYRVHRAVRWLHHRPAVPRSE